MNINQFNDYITEVKQILPNFYLKCSDKYICLQKMRFNCLPSPNVKWVLCHFFLHISDEITLKLKSV